jgi:hypothetical protein
MNNCFSCKHFYPPTPDSYMEPGTPAECGMVEEIVNAIDRHYLEIDDNKLRDMFFFASSFGKCNFREEK